MKIQVLLLYLVLKWLKLKKSGDGLDNAIALILFPFVLFFVFVIVCVVGNDTIYGYNVPKTL